jgi:hypothetical protein
MIHTRRFPPRRFHAITLFPIIFYNDGPMTARDIRHETVHLWQQAVLLVVPFYVLYLFFWAVNLVRFRNAGRAYREIPFERSAYRLEAMEGLVWMTMAFDWLKTLPLRSLFV